jgi:hypothetical protein
MKRVQKICNGGKLLLVIMLLAMPLAAAPAWGTSYFIYGQWGGTWQDANKNRVDDSLMCWAASAADILAWGKWTTPTYNTATTIFQDFKDHWTNGRGWQSWAWQWWLQGTPPPTTTYAYINVPWGGDYFPTSNFSSYYATVSGPGELAAMDQLMHQGCGISLVITKGTASHAITCWGFDYTVTNGQTDYTAVHYTDSDDGVTALKTMTLAYNNGWYFTSGYTGWLLSGIYGLEMYGGQTIGSMETGSNPRKKKKGNPHLAAGVAPIAPTWRLLGTGLILLAIIWNRRRNGASRLN